MIDQLVKINEASALLCVSIRTVRRLVSARKIPFFRVSGSIRFAKKDLDNYLKSCRIPVMEYRKP